MNCPLDNTPLAISERQGIEIDYCPKCRGVWLDRGELDKLIERGAQYETRRDQELVEQFQSPATAPQTGQPSQQSPYPQVQPDDPQSQQRPHGSGPDLAGIALDLINKGLDKRRQSNQYGGSKKKKGGLLGELFDF